MTEYSATLERANRMESRYPSKCKELLESCLDDEEISEGDKHNLNTRVNYLKNSPKTNGSKAGKSTKSSKAGLLAQYLDKKWHDQAPQALPDLPLSALKGMSEKKAKVWEDAFNVKTIRQLRNLKFVKWAESIQHLARYE